MKIWIDFTNSPHVNFFEPFMHNNPDTLYFKKDNNHWNDRGQDIAAQKTAAYITLKNLLK